MYLISNMNPQYGHNHLDNKDYMKGSMAWAQPPTVPCYHFIHNKNLSRIAMGENNKGTIAEAHKMNHIN